MLKKSNKKGFTLAELLIVVAIIAVLTAIAVPLFVGALNDAETKVLDANKRAVRGAAVEQILMENTLLYKNNGDGTKKRYEFWEVEALIDASGDIIALNIVPKDTNPNTKEECIKTTTTETKEIKTGVKGSPVKSVDGGYYVKLQISELKSTSQEQGE